MYAHICARYRPGAAHARDMHAFLSAPHNVPLDHDAPDHVASTPAAGMAVGAMHGMGGQIRL
jgi:hypothetical protein